VFGVTSRGRIARRRSGTPAATPRFIGWRQDRGAPRPRGPPRRSQSVRPSSTTRYSISENPRGPPLDRGRGSGPSRADYGPPPFQAGNLDGRSFIAAVAPPAPRVEGRLADKREAQASPTHREPPPPPTRNSAPRKAATDPPGAGASPVIARRKKLAHVTGCWRVAMRTLESVGPRTPAGGGPPAARALASRRIRRRTIRLWSRHRGRCRACARAGEEFGVRPP
jgi:hypothetical protein